MYVVLLRLKSEDNIKMKLWENGLEDVGRFCVAQDRGKLRAVVNSVMNLVMNLRVP